jgi:hypothetical protein
VRTINGMIYNTTAPMIQDLPRRVNKLLLILLWKNVLTLANVNSKYSIVGLIRIAETELSFMQQVLNTVIMQTVWDGISTREILDAVNLYYLLMLYAYLTKFIIPLLVNRLRRSQKPILYIL